ncbi:MAG: TonB family protein [Marinilabiliaceae bacterium]|nr:TonB family protein [Marinilabiliaceae bacterium]
MKKTILLITLSAICTTWMNGQSTIMFDKKDNITKKKEKAITIREVGLPENGRCYLKEYDNQGVLVCEGQTNDAQWAMKYKNVFKTGQWITYTPDGKKSSKHIYSDKAPEELSKLTPQERNLKLEHQNGLLINQVSYYPDGQIEDSIAITYANKKQCKHIVSYHRNGQLQRDEISENLKTIKGVCYDTTGAECEFFPFEVMPEFPGGERALLQFVTSSMQYPVEAAKAKIEGRVFVRFIVDEKGEVTDAHIAKSSPNHSLNMEALRVVRAMPAWSPGKIKGKPVPVKFTLPVNFKLR